MKKLHQNNKGIAHLAIVIVVIVLAAVGGVGYKVWKNKQDKDKKAKETSQQTQKPEEKKEENKIPDGFVEYKNSEIGFYFIYPKEWGNVIMSNNDKDVANKVETGKRYIFKFSKEDHAQVGVAEKDLKILLGRDGSCSATGFADYKELEKQEDGVTSTESGKYVTSTSRFLLNEKNEQVIETYGPSAGICSGLSIWGQKSFAGKRYNGANTSYYLSIETDNDAKAQDMVKKYKADPTSVLSNKVRDQIVQVTKSLAEL